MKVLVIDNDTTRQHIVRPVRQAEFTVVEASPGSAGLSLAAVHRPAVIVIRERAPLDCHYELLPALKQVVDAPIIVIGAGDREAKVRALLQGADYYLTQPVGDRELLARVHALLRRYCPMPD